MTNARNNISTRKKTKTHVIESVVSRARFPKTRLPSSDESTSNALDKLVKRRPLEVDDLKAVLKGLDLKNELDFGSGDNYDGFDNYDEIELEESTVRAHVQAVSVQTEEVEESGFNNSGDNLNALKNDTKNNNSEDEMGDDNDLGENDISTNQFEEDDYEDMDLDRSGGCHPNLPITVNDMKDFMHEDLVNEDSNSSFRTSISNLTSITTKYLDNGSKFGNDQMYGFGANQFRRPESNMSMPVVKSHDAMSNASFRSVAQLNGKNEISYTNDKNGKNDKNEKNDLFRPDSRGAISNSNSKYHESSLKYQESRHTESRYSDSRYAESHFGAESRYTESRCKTPNSTTSASVSVFSFSTSKSKNKKCVKPSKVKFGKQSVHVGVEEELEASGIQQIIVTELEPELAKFAMRDSFSIQQNSKLKINTSSKNKLRAISPVNRDFSSGQSVSGRSVKSIKSIKSVKSVHPHQSNSMRPVINLNESKTTPLNKPMKVLKNLSGEPNSTKNISQLSDVFGQSVTSEIKHQKSKKFYKSAKSERVLTHNGPYYEENLRLTPVFEKQFGNDRKLVLKPVVEMNDILKNKSFFTEKITQRLILDLCAGTKQINLENPDKFECYDGDLNFDDFL